MEQRLVGFTARKTGYDWRLLWPPERASTYLLTSEKLDAVCSLDEASWPSVFSLRPVHPPTWNEQAQRLLSGPPEPEGWIGTHNPLWSELRNLKAELARHGTELWRPYILLGVTVIAPEHVHEEWGLLSPDEINPPEVSSEWKFLGYDICDDMLSGLTNCGYEDGDFLEKSRDHWASRLNSFHLFHDLDASLDFLDFTNSRVEEHAPFSVVGLYEVEVVTA